MAERRKKKGSDEGGVPGWVVTFGDMMSLLLCFFVLLLSFSVISEEEFTQAAASIRSAFGLLPLQMAIVPIEMQPEAGHESHKERSEDAENVARRIRQRLQKLGMQRDIEVSYDRDGGIKISLPDTVLFDSGQAQLVPEAYPVLNEMAALLGDIAAGAFIEVRGHTDDRPVASTNQFRDNFDLSYQRAYSVARQLSVAGSIPQDQLEIVAVGAAEPIATNTTEAGRSANRRVDIHVRGLFTRDKVRDLEQQIRALQEEALQ